MTLALLALTGNGCELVLVSAEKTHTVQWFLLLNLELERFISVNNYSYNGIGTGTGTVGKIFVKQFCYFHLPSSCLV